MSYKVLYRQYRPTTFDDVSGQHTIVKTLKNAVHNNKIAHAYLLSGPRGTGKTSLAKIFAKAVNCTGDVKPCGTCENCISYEEGTHPDVIEIDAASNNGVDEVRNLIDKVKYAPLIGKYKVYIIDEVHMMTQGAYNALLKTIEEPPAHVIFILATTEPYKVITTIISRCQRFDFSKIEKEQIVQRLKYVCEHESIVADDKAIELIAVLANGGMRDALSILDQCQAYSMEQIILQDVYDIYGILTVQDKIELLKHVKKNETALLIKKINDFHNNGIDMKRLTSDLIDILKEKVIYDYTSDANLLDLQSVSEVEELQRLFTTKESLVIIDILLATFEKFKVATNIVSYLEIAFLNLIANVSRETLQVTSTKETTEKTKTESSILTMAHIDEEETLDSPLIQEETTPNDEVIKEVFDTNYQNQLKEFTPIKDDYILGLLVSATKSEKEEDKQMIEKSSMYQMDIEFARFSNLLRNIDIIASGVGFIIVRTTTQILANEINEIDKEGNFRPFLKKLTNKDKKMFAITNIQYERVVNEFKIKHRTNSLPDPIVFTFEAEKKKETVEDSLKILFGDNIEVREE